MPAHTPTPDDIWNKTISFLSIDTDVLQSNGFQFDKGALNQLPHQLPDDMQLLLTQVVMEEVKKHRIQPVRKAVEQITTSIGAISRSSGIDMSSVDVAVGSLRVVTTSAAAFDNELHSYAARCNGTILPWNELDAAMLFDDYFAQKPPFEEGKKSEFPDAASMQILEQYAESNDTMGIIISGDSGWKDFAASSERLYYFNTLDELTALLVATGKSADDVEAKIKEHLAQSDSALIRSIDKAIGRHIGEAQWDTSGWVPDVGDRMDVTVYGSDVQSVKLSDDIDIWRDNDDGDDAWVVQLSASVVVKLNVEAELYKWDSIDKEELRLASDLTTLTDEIDVTFYVRLTNLRLDKGSEDWNIDVDIATADYYLGSVEYRFNFG